MPGEQHLAVSKHLSALEVYINYPVGKTNMVPYQQTPDRLEAIVRLPEEKKNYLFCLIDKCLRDFKARKAYAKRIEPGGAGIYLPDIYLPPFIAT